jgi:sugar-specific transcriptional regulator TrmB
MTLEDLFSRLGLGKHSASVYELLSRSKEPLRVAHIAQKTKLARQQIYRNLEELIREGFVTKVIEGKSVMYKAESPRRIEEAFGRVLEKTTSLLKKREKEAPAHLRFFKGFAGIRAVFDDAIDHTPKGDTFYRYTSERDLKAVNRYLSPTYRARRDKKKLERLVISNPASGKQKASRLERFIKYVDSDSFEQDIIQLVYGKRLAFINLKTEEAFIVEDEALASFQKVIFRQLYRKL